MMTSMKDKFGSYRFLAVLLCVALLSACGVNGAHGSVSAGNQYLAHGKYRAAYIEAKKALQKNEANGKAWLLLAKASLMLGNPNDALSDLGNAQSNGVSQSQLAVPMARALLVTRHYHKLIKSIKLSQKMSGKQKVAVLAARGEAMLALGLTAPAQYTYQSAVQLAPNDAQPLVGLARVALADHDVDTARQYLKKAQTLAPHDPQIWATKGDAALTAGNLATAEADYTKAISQKHGNLLPQEQYSLIAKLAETELRQNELKSALKHIQTLEKMGPGEPYGHYLHAAVDFKQGKMEDAVSQLQQVLKVMPNSVPAQLLMGAVNYAQNNLAQADMYLSNVLGEAPDNTAARNLLGLTLYREGESHQALKVLRPLMGKNGSSAKMLAMLQQEAGQGARLFKPSSSGTRNGPAGANTFESEFGRANEAMAKGQVGQAIRVLKAMPKGTPSQEYARTRMMVLAYLRNGQRNQARKLAAGYAQSHEKQSDAHLLYGSVLMSEGKFEQAKTQFLRGYKLDSKNIAALLSLGAVDGLAGHDKSARKRYQTVLRLQPKNVQALAALGELSEKEGHKRTAARYFGHVRRLAPKLALPYIELALLYSREGQFKKALSVAKAFHKKVPASPVALNALGAAELNAGHHEAALASLQKAVKADPKNLLYRLNLARSEILTHHFKSAEKDLAQVVKARPQVVRAVAMLAFLKAKSGHLMAGVALADQLAQYPKTKVAGRVLKGDLYMSAAQYKKAAAAYDQAFKIDHSRSAVIQLFRARTAAGMAGAGSVLESWLKGHPKDDAVRMLLGQYQLSEHHYAKAVAQYEKVLKKYPNNVAALNNLAYVYVEQKDKRALSYAKKAYQLAPKASPIEDTYGWALVQAGEAKVAVPILRSAARKASKNPEIHYHLAVALAQTGNKKDAEKTLQTLLQTKASFSDKANAKKLYDRLAAGNPATN